WRRRRPPDRHDCRQDDPAGAGHAGPGAHAPKHRKPAVDRTGASWRDGRHNRPRDWSRRPYRETTCLSPSGEASRHPPTYGRLARAADRQGPGTPESLHPGMNIGIIGAGQLGRMLALAGYPLGLLFTFLDTSRDAPGAQAGQLIRCRFDDAAALRKLASVVYV